MGSHRGKRKRPGRARRRQRGVPVALCSQLPVLSLPLVSLVRLRSGSVDPVLTPASLASRPLGSSRANEDEYKVEEGKVKTGKASRLFSPRAKQDHTG